MLHHRQPLTSGRDSWDNLYGSDDTLFKQEGIMRHPLTVNVLLLSLLTSGIHVAVAEEKPQQAQPDNPGNFNYSGYIEVIAAKPSAGKARLVLDEVSLFITGHVNKWVNPFVETELSRITILQAGGRLFSNNSGIVDLERLYNDSYLTGNLSLRVGKMLTPIGEWNLVHAAPLVWTTTRPLTTYRSFNQFTSGISLNYADANSALPEIQLYTQPDGEILPKRGFQFVRNYLHVTGLHLNWPWGLNDKLGLSFQHSQVENTDEQQTLSGFNFNKEFGHLAFETEAVHAHISGLNAARVRDNEWGAYLQGAYALNEHWYLLGRYEYFADRGYDTASEHSLLGVSYKSAPSTVWKLEYVKQHGQQLNISTGLFASFSAFF